MIGRMTASGTFDVKLTPQAPDDTSDGAVGRMTIDKQFKGDKGTFALQGRTGTFALQHSGTMTRGAQSLTLTVVPDSGTGELAGISGSMKIIITGGKHFYDFDYTVLTA